MAKKPPSATGQQVQAEQPKEAEQKVPAGAEGGERTRLSGDFDAEKIEASSANGVLRLTIPRVEQAEARTIKIKAGS